MEKERKASRDWTVILERWFDPRRRDLGMWAYVLNRLSGLLLVIYLFVHLVALSQLAMGPAGYDRFVSLVESPWFLAFDVGLIALLLYHGLNGLRLTLVMLGIGVGQHRAIFWVVMGLGMIVLVVSAYLIFLP